MRKSLAGALLVIVLAAGCGDGKHARPTPSRTTTVRSPLVRALIRDYKRLGADVRRLRADAADVHSRTLLGTPALRRDTGRFIDDLERSHLSLKARNREIDHAAAAVAPSCDQCFQMLEAIRPIPQIAGH